MKSVLVAFLALAVSSATLMGQAPATAPAETVSGQPMTETERAIRRKLAKKLANVKFDKLAFKSVVEWMQSTTSVNIAVRWSMLENAGITPETQVKDLSLTDVRADTAMKEVLRAVGGNAPLDYAVKDEVLVISLAGDPDFSETVVYDVSELVEGVDGAERADIEQRLVGGLLNSLGANYAQLVKGSLVVMAQHAHHEKIRAARPPSPRAMARQSAEQITAVLSMKETCFDPQAMCVAALGCLRTETKETPAQLAKTLEALLGETKAVGVRNAIRLMLKDLYIQAGNMEKVKEHLQGIIKDNEKAAQEAGPTAPRAPAPPGTGSIFLPPPDGGVPVNYTNDATHGPARGGTAPPPDGMGRPVSPPPDGGRRTAPPPDAGANSVNH